jgi:hypothetical protein
MLESFGLDNQVTPEEIAQVLFAFIHVAIHLSKLANIHLS